MKYWGQSGEDIEQGGKESQKKKKKTTVLANLKLSFLFQEKMLQHVPVNLPHIASQCRQEG